MEILALVEAPGHVCCRYRIEAFEPYLNRLGLRLTYQAIESNPVKRLAQMRAAGRFDSVILQRKLLDTLSFTALRRAAKHLVFDFDDAVLYRDSYSAKGHHCPRRRARFERIATDSDIILAGNSFLALRAEEHGARSTKVHFMPTCINLAAYEAAAAQRQPRNDDRLVMVWIGSSSTLKGLEATRSLWERIGQSVPNAILRVVCDRFPTFRHLEVERVEWSQAGEIPAIVTADIGISHVPDDLWSRGKCGLKVLQYLAGGLPVLTNPVGVHAEMVTSGRTGFLLDHAREWLEAVEWFSRNRDRARAMGHEAVDVIRRGYDVADWAVFFADRVAPGSVSPQWPQEMQRAGRGWVLDQASAPTAHCSVTQQNKAERGVAQ